MHACHITEQFSFILPDTLHLQYKIEKQTNKNNLLKLGCESAATADYYRISSSNEHEYNQDKFSRIIYNSKRLKFLL